MHFNVYMQKRFGKSVNFFVTGSSLLKPSIQFRSQKSLCNSRLNLGRTVSPAPTVAFPVWMLLHIPVIVLYLRTLSGVFAPVLAMSLMQKSSPLVMGLTQSSNVFPKLLIWPMIKLIKMLVKQKCRYYKHMAKL